MGFVEFIQVCIIISFRRRCRRRRRYDQAHTPILVLIKRICIYCIG